MQTNQLDPPAQVGGETWGSSAINQAITCVPKVNGGSPAASDVDECCKKRCECVLNGVAPCAPFTQAQFPVVCATHNEDPSVPEATPVPDLQNPSVAQACNGNEIGLELACSPNLNLPEGQPKAQVASALDSTSKVQVAVNGHKSPILTPSGYIRYTVEPCGSATCPVHLVAYRFTVPSFSIGSDTIDDVVVQDGRQDTAGTLTTATGDFTLPALAMRVATNFAVSGTNGSITIHNGTSLVGNIDPITRIFTLHGLVSQTQNSTTVDLDLDLHATPFNLPPIAVANPHGTIECNTFFGASVVLDASSSTDPDNNIGSFSWGLANVGLVGSGETFPFVIPYGPRAIDLYVVDKEFADSRDHDLVNVADTTAPSLSATVDACLWAPDHKMILFDSANGFTTVAKDVCDPSPTVTVTNVTSNQPPLGGGQGNFAPDVLFGAKAFCVRAERQGTNPSPRTYSVTVQAKDFAGNTTVKPLTVVVNHDQLGPKCPAVPSSRVVSDTDPRCTAN